MVGFASQLRLLIDALAMSLDVKFMEDFVSGLILICLFVCVCFLNPDFSVFTVETSGSDKLRSSAVIPPPTVLDRVLKDLCHDGK